MANLWVGLAEVFSWAVRASTYAVAAIIIISLVQIVGRRWLPARWIYAFWLILLVRLALPSGPESRLSLWNLLPQVVYGVGPAKSGQKAGEQDRVLPVDPSFQTARSGSLSPPLNGDALIPKDPAVHDRPQNESKTKSVLQAIWQLTPVIWLAGTLILATGIAVNNLRLWRSVRKLRLVTDQPLLELFEDCKQLVHVRTVVGLVITNHVKSPSLFGFVRPRVLLPADLTSHIPLEELRYIFLHELAHFKRGDIWISWIVAFLQSLHWFNPLVWWAFSGMRADREVACDALALSFVRGEDSGRYGGALINLLERFSHSQHLPVVAGILENKAQLKRRLTMITQFKRPTRREGIVAVALLVILSAALLTDAKDNSPLIQEQSAVNPSKRDPIKVGGGIQQSKLIYKVEPTYPENAKAAGLSGKVVLQVTTNEEGFVSDVKAVDGHPILADAAFAAVKQWRYSPTTLLSGEPVPVTTTVTVVFSTGGAVDTAFKEEPSSMQGYFVLPILVPPDLSDQRAPARIHIKPTPFYLYEGRKYYPVVPGISAPTLAIDKPRLRELANANWPTDGTPISSAPMYFVMYIDKDGGIAGIWQAQGPKIPEINKELANTRVMASGRFGSEAVPVWVGIEIDLPPLK
jgi:bla regulator protein BlaR1